jgi:hypothetical protein
MQVSRCDAKHARTAHHQENAPSHESTLRWGSFAASSWSAAQLPCGCSRKRPAGVSGWRVCNIRTLGGKAAGDVPRLAARPRAGEGGPRAHRQCAWLVAQQLALVCLSKGVSRLVALGSRKCRRGEVLHGVSVPASACAHRGRLRGDRRDGGVPHELEHSFCVCGLSLPKRGKLH